ncbi:ferritin-like domain-containing protein [Flavobacterium sp. LB2P74]|uniref:ferritin-like domain-containing protein n=1 Tax=Flavobacterium sp. LB2P74 TaxID=3401717 RepID=UPI003AAE3CE5
MDTEKSIDVLNSLIQINNDRIEGYETASKEAEESDLKILFSHFTETSLKCKAELVAEVERLGGKPTEGTTTSGKLYRVWMDIKSALTGSDRKAIVNSCEYGEDVAVQTYNDALSHNKDLTPEQIMMIKEQHDAIKANHDKIKNLRDLMG